MLSRSFGRKLLPTAAARLAERRVNVLGVPQGQNPSRFRSLRLS